MAAVSNTASEQPTELAEDNPDGSDDEHKDNVDLGVSGLPQVNFAGSNNKFETINLDGDGDDEEDEDPDRELSDDRRRKKYRKKKKRNQPLEDSSDSSTDDERKSCRRKKETDVDPVNTSSFVTPIIIHSNSVSSLMQVRMAMVQSLSFNNYC